MTQVNLLDQILSGTNRPLQVLAAQGLVPLAPDELIPIQIALTGSPDREIAEHAASTLASLEPRHAESFLAETATPSELAYFARQIAQPAFLEVILQRPDVPRQLLVDVAGELSAELQEVLVLRQDAILDEPQILVALERNPALSAYARRRIWEYREHLLPREKVPPKSVEEIAAEAEALSEEDVEEAIVEVRENTPASDGLVIESVILTEAQIRSLPVPIRLRMARGASRHVRNVLIRDTNAQVAVAVLHGNTLPDQEVEQIANSRAVPAEVLIAIPKKREWIRKYSIVKALVKNPKTPLATALRFVRRLTVFDLRILARDKNVAEGVRALALRLYQAKR